MKLIRCMAVLVVMALALGANAQVTKDDGGVTFPVVANFTDADGTEYTTRMWLHADTTNSVFLRYIFTTTDGTRHDWTDIYNAMLEGNGGAALGYLYAWNRDWKPAAGTVRIVPVDQSGNVVPGIHLSGHARIYVQNKRGALTTERVDGLSDKQLLNLATNTYIPIITTTLLPNQTRMFFVTNYTSQPRTFKASLGNSVFMGPGAVKWDWSDSVTVAPNSSGMLLVAPVAQEIFDANLFGLKIYHSLTGTVVCVDCNHSTDVYTATYVEIDQATNDLRVTDNAFDFIF